MKRVTGFALVMQRFEASYWFKRRAMNRTLSRIRFELVSIAGWTAARKGLFSTRGPRSFLRHKVLREADLMSRNLVRR